MQNKGVIILIMRINKDGVKLSLTPSKLDSIQNRAKRVIGLPSNEYEDRRIQLLSHRRAVGAATLFYRMFYKEAPELLCQLMPDIHVMTPGCDGLWDPMT